MSDNSILEDYQREFYKNYNPDYWLYKISLLKDCHDNFDEIKGVLERNIEKADSGDYKRVLRTEMHFLYFQMVESLFEIIFGVAKHDNRNLWLTLSFSNWRQTYKEISDLTESSFLFNSKIKTSIKGEEAEIPLLQWIFYFVYLPQMKDEELKINLKNIAKLLLIFAKDFSDRGEYNAYKHALRFYNSSFAMSIGYGNSSVSLGSSENSIVYLEEQQKKVNGKFQNTGAVMRTIKPFDFERDYNCCRLVHALIANIINTRKYSILPELHGKNFQFYTFKDVDVLKATIPKTGITRSSFTI